MSEIKEPQSISMAELESVAYGTHGDPFKALGPHPFGDGLVVRAFLPQATAVQLLHNNETIPMHKVYWDGFYEGFLPNQSLPVSYQLRVTSHAGVEVTLHDPYNFSSTLTDFDNYLLAEGTHMQMYDRLGAHLVTIDGVDGVQFAVWAPTARRVSVVGDFNDWDGRRHPMRFHPGSGIWEMFIPGLSQGTLYKYEIKTNYQDYTVAKADPVGFASQLRPETASIVYDINQYHWNDQSWIEKRTEYNSVDAPISIYELHLGSWRRKNGWEWLTYDDLIRDLIPYIKEMGFTHIELLPVSEHPFDGSWGYQVTGYFAPTSRFGDPEGFMRFVDACHQAEIGVILDWVPAHFPTDQHGLGFFDGTHLYEHDDPRKGAHPDWGTYIFNYGRNEVRQFLISNALFWLDKYHIDGLRVDAVASMLYLDFSREQGAWVPNRYGGRENIEAITFIRETNNKVHEHFPGVLMIAEESTSWPGVTHDTAANGLGFDLKWNMGWMHDTLQYFSNEPVYRSFHQGSLTFSMLYAFSEKFALPFSHDEVVHLKKSMVDKMPGDMWQKFANLRLLYGYQWSHPGKKLLFMGGEFGQWREWSEERSLDWHLIDENPLHGGVQKYVARLNELYKAESPLYIQDHSWEGFYWLDFRDSQRSILAYGRQNPHTGEEILVVCNFTPVVRHEYRLGVPRPGSYVEILNSDAAEFGGSDVVNEGEFTADNISWHSQHHSITITLPPLGVVFFKKK